MSFKYWYLPENEFTTHVPLYFDRGSFISFPEWREEFSTVVEMKLMMQIYVCLTKCVGVCHIPLSRIIAAEYKRECYPEAQMLNRICCHWPELKIRTRYMDLNVVEYFLSRYNLRYEMLIEKVLIKTKLINTCFYSSLF